MLRSRCSLDREAYACLFQSDRVKNGIPDLKEAEVISSLLEEEVGDEHAELSRDAVLRPGVGDPSHSSVDHHGHLGRIRVTSACERTPDQAWELAVFGIIDLTSAGQL